MTTKLTNNQIRRYGRHLILDKIGLDVQKKICASSVLVIGAGGLGSPVLMSLAGAGIGKIGIVDHDTVSITNLHRQTIYKQEDESKLKAECAKKAMKALNPSIEVTSFARKLGQKNALELIEQYDIIADCTDNMYARYVINDYSVLAGKPVVSAAAIGLEGQVSVYNYKNGPCLRCLFPEKSPTATVKNCSDNGVFGSIPSIIGSLQGLEVLKVAGDFGETLRSKFSI